MSAVQNAINPNSNVGVEEGGGGQDRPYDAKLVKRARVHTIITLNVLMEYFCD